MCLLQFVKLFLESIWGPGHLEKMLGTTEVEEQEEADWWKESQLPEFKFVSCSFGSRQTNPGINTNYTACTCFQKQHSCSGGSLNSRQEDLYGNCLTNSETVPALGNFTSVPSAVTTETMLRHQRQMLIFFFFFDSLYKYSCNGLYKLCWHPLKCKTGKFICKLVAHLPQKTNEQTSCK